MAKKDPKTITELQPGTNDWIKAFDALSPQDQASIFGQATTPAVDYTFGNAAADPLGWGQIAGNDPLGLGQISAPAGRGGAPVAPGFQGIEMDPMYQQLVQSGGGVNIPTLTSKGALEPYDLGQEAAMVNLMQDNATSMADLIQAAMAGPGAIDPQAFAPVVTKPTERIATPGLTRLNNYAERGGYQGFIARKIRDEGASDAEATADLYNTLATDDSKLSPEALDYKKELIESMESAFGSGQQLVPPSGGRGQNQRASQETRNLYDESDIAKWATDLYEKVSEDQAKVDVGYEDPEHPGSYFTEAPTEEDSPAMQKFRNLGLPSPFESYTDPDRMEQMYQAMAPSMGAEGAAWEGNVARTAAEQERIGKEERGINERNLATQKLFKENFQPAGFVPPPGAGPPPVPRAAFAGRNTPQSMVRLPLHEPPAPFSLAPANFQPDRMKQDIGGIANPAGGFDFETGVNPQQRAMANKLVNFIGSPLIGGGEKRGTEVVPLNQETAKQSAAQAAEARKRYAAANAARFGATQALGDDQRNSILAWENARHAAMRGDTPFIDVMKQRKLGQRAQGVRA